VEWFTDKLFQQDEVFYQRFIPPHLEDGHAEKTRMHIIATPLESSYLSTHRSVSAPVVPDECPYGLIEDLAPYLLNFCQGAYFSPSDEKYQEEIEIAARDICKIIDIGFTEKFSCYN
jgi:hypothetical protein